MRRWVKCFVSVFLGGLFFASIISKNTYARAITCDDKEAQDNNSMSNACSLRGGNRGAMWFSTKPSSYSDIIRRTDLEANGSTAVIYLNGAVLTNEKRTEDNPFWGKHINILATDGCRQAAGGCEPNSSKIKNIESYMGNDKIFGEITAPLNRGYKTYDGLGFTHGWGSQKITFNVEKFKEAAEKRGGHQENSNTWSLTVHVYRCFGDNTNAGACYSDPSTIIYKEESVIEYAARTLLYTQSNGKVLYYRANGKKITEENYYDEWHENLARFNSGKNGNLNMNAQIATDYINLQFAHQMRRVTYVDTNNKNAYSCFSVNTGPLGSMTAATFNWYRYDECGKKSNTSGGFNGVGIDSFSSNGLADIESNIKAGKELTNVYNKNNNKSTDNPGSAQYALRNLPFGEAKTYCSEIKYQSDVKAGDNARVAMGQDNSSICITISRPSKKVTSEWTATVSEKDDGKSVTSKEDEKVVKKNGTYYTSGDTVTVSFNDTLSAKSTGWSNPDRSGNYTEYRTYYTVNGSKKNYDPNSGYNKVSYSSGTKKWSPASLDVKLELGKTTTVCQYLEYSPSNTFNRVSKIDENVFDNDISRAGKTTTSRCIKITRPYNFDTEVSAKINEIPYTGETVTVGFSAKSKAIESKWGLGSYGTALPEHSVKIALFTTTAKSLEGIQDGLKQTGNDISAADKSRSNNTYKNLCSFIQSYDKSEITECVEESPGIDASEEKKGKTYTISRKVLVPEDLEIGDKMCVATGVTQRYNDGTKPTDGVGNWKVSSISCKTVSAKPNMEVWNSGVYLNGNLKTSVSPKSHDDNLSLANYDQAKNEPHTKRYGSWSEYTSIIGKNVTGFATGSGYGFIDGAKYGADFCKLSKLTIANTEVTISNKKYGGACSSTGTATSSDEAGGSGVDASIGDTISRLIARYRPDTPYGSNTIPTASLVIIADGETKVYYFDGTLKIENNICAGHQPEYGKSNERGNCLNSGSALNLSSRNYSKFTSASQLPQILIFAKNIEISADVDQIDAWLIATGDDDTGGNINTCADFSVGKDLSNQKCNKTLMINGPVFAKTVTLNRTANDRGSNTEELTTDLKDLKSMTTAEIFNLRPDSYLWAHNQAAQMTQASVSNIKELAPRQ